MLQPQTPPQPWELDRLPREALEATYAQLADFVAWLQETGLAVPPCWYLHRHLVHRLAAIMWWRVQAYQDSTTPKGSVPAAPQDAAQWWASPSGMDGWLRRAAELRTEECGGSLTLHRPKRGAIPPTLEEAVRQHVADVADVRAWR